MPNNKAGDLYIDVTPEVNVDVDGIVKAIQTELDKVANKDFKVPIKIKAEDILGKSFVETINKAQASLESLDASLKRLGNGGSIGGSAAEIKELTDAIKNFSIFKIRLGGSNPIAQATKFANEASLAFGKLQSQASELEKVFKYEYRLGDKTASKSGISGIIAAATDDNKYKQLLEYYNTALTSKNDGGVGASQVRAMRDYINLVLELANTYNIDLSSATSKFTQSADEIVRDTERAASGAEELEESLKKLEGAFKSDINAEELMSHLNGIRESLTTISSILSSSNMGGDAFQNLTNSVNAASQAVVQLMDNLNDLVQNGGVNINGGSGGGGGGGGGNNRDRLIKRVEKDLIESGKHLEWTAAQGLKDGQDDVYALMEQNNRDFQDILNKAKNTKTKTKTLLALLDKREREMTHLERVVADAGKNYKSSGDKRIDQRLLTGGSKEGDDAIAKVTRFIETTEKEQQKVTAASIGAKKKEYGDITSTISDARTLVNEIKNGSVAVSDFEQRFASLQKTARVAFEEITKAGENYKDFVLVNDPNDANFKKYTDAASHIAELQNKIQENRYNWGAAGEAGSPVAAEYSTYINQAAALETLNNDLKSGKLTWSEYAARVQDTEKVMRTCAESIKQARLNIKADTNDARLIKEYNTLEKQANKLSEKITKNSGLWTKAKSGKTSSEYAQYVDLINDLSALQEKINLKSASPEKVAKELDAISKKAGSLESAMKSAGEATGSFGQKAASVVKTLAKWYGTHQIMMTAVRYFKQMVSTSMEVESAMTRIQIVTGSTDEQMSNFFQTASQQAQELGKSITEVASSIETFSRLGYSLPDASDLSKYANIMANVGATTVDAATSGITSIIKAYDLDAADAEHVADVLIEVGQKYAISAEELMQAFERGGAALAASGTSFEQSAGLFAATNAALQNASTTGTVWKTVSARIRGAKTELEELGEYSDDLAEGFSKYRKELKQLTGVDIMIDEHTYKDMLTIFTELAQGWDDLADTSQARVAEILGGTRNLSGVMSTVQNIADAQNAYADAMNSAGTATEANNLYMDTASAHLAQLKAALQEFSTDAANSDFLKNGIDILKGFINLLNKLIDNFGMLSVAIAGVGIAKFVTELKDLAKATGGIKSLSDLLTASGMSLATFATPVTAVVAGVAVLTAAIAAYKKHQEDLRRSAQESAIAFNQTNESLSNQAIRVKELREAIESGNLTESESLAAKSELIDIQNSLIDTYGRQAEGIDLVNGKLDEEIAKMRELSVEEAKQYLNENRSSIEKATAQMTSNMEDLWGVSTYMGQFFDRGEADEETKAINELIDKYKDYLRVVDQGDGSKLLYFDGTAEEAHRVINDIMTDMRHAKEDIGDSFALDDLLSYSGSVLADANNIIDKYKEIYETAQMARIAEDQAQYSFYGRSNTAAGWLNDYAKAIEEYNNALAGGEDESITKAKNEFVKLDHAIGAMIADDGSMAKYAAQFNELKGTLNEAAIGQRKYNKYLSELKVPARIAKMSVDDFVNAWNVGADEEVAAIVDRVVELGYVSEATEDSVRYLATSIIDGANDAAMSIGELKSQLETFGKYQEAVNSALTASHSATGLSADDITALTNAYEALNKEGRQIFDPSALFENTYNGIHLNEEELRRLNAAVEENMLSELYDTLIEKQTRLQLLNNQQTKDEKAISLVEDEIAKTKQLISQYEGMTSALNIWKNAQSSGDERDNYAAVGKGYADMKKLIDQGWDGDDELEAYLDLLLSSDKRVGTVKEQFDQLSKTIDGTTHSLMSYWQYNKDDELVNGGLVDFLDDVIKLQAEGKALEGEKFVWLEDDGYHFDVTGDKIDRLAKAFGTTPEMIQLFERAMIDAGIQVKLYNFGLESTLEDMAKLQESGDIRPDIDFSDVDTSSLDSVISKIEEAKEVRADIDVNSDGAQEKLETIDRYIAALDSQRISLEIDAQIESGRSVDELLSMDDTELMETIHVDDTELEEARKKLEALKDGSVDTAITVRIDEEQFTQLTPEDKNATVVYDVDSSEPDSYIPNVKYADVIYQANTKYLPESLPTLTRFVNYQAIGNVPTGDHGTAFGTLGRAHATGSIALDRDQISLVNELGTESLIRDGQWMLLGGGMHQADLKKGDIILSAEQTKALLMTGSAPGRGRAYAYGTLLSTAYGVGSGAIRKVTGTKTAATRSSSKSSGGSSRSGGNRGVSSSTSNSKPDIETIDWIEVAIERIERAIDHLGQVAGNVFEIFATRMKASADQITKTSEEITLQQKARDRYMRQANSVGLSADLAKLVREGTIDIRDYNKETAELIKNYSNWYSKVKDCEDAIKSLNIELGNLYQERFSATADEVERQLTLLGHLTNTYNNALDDIDERGYLASTKYYSAMREVEERNLALRKQELTDLIARMSDAVNSGAIKEGSEAWQEMQADINGVKESIQQTETQLVKLDNTIRETLWDRFEYLQDLISNVTEEADFLIKLMSSSDLFTDSGQLTETGLSTMGLHGQNYNVYMNQADRYAEKIKELNAEIANDPNNTKLLEQREKWLKSQRDSILNAEDEKEAIVKLVEDGIKKELEALKELINTYNESLDSAKDLYEYQKKVNGQADEVAKIQKRLAAYQGDTSEESRKTIQQLNNSLKDAMENLQETQQERALSEQKKMLDNMYSEYEEILNSRLDDIDRLMADMIDVINTNSGTIGNTIDEAADNVGYTISESIKDIWVGGGLAQSVVAQYGDNFLSSMTSITAVLERISLNVAAMVKASDETADTTISSTTSTTAANKPAATAGATSSTKKTTTSNNNGGHGIVTPNLGTINDRLNVRNAPGMNGQIIRQVMNGNLLETDWKEQNGWLHVRIHNAQEDYWGWVSKSLIKAYAKGAKHIGHSGVAWTQENGSEAIIRASDNAILTKLQPGDSVLKSSATSNIFDFGNNPREFLAKLGITSANDAKRIADGLGVSAVNVGGININIPIEHVQDYNDLVNQMKTDDRFERFIQSMTVDRLVGGSKLAKTKYKWS